MHSAQTEGKSKVMKEKQIFINIKSKKKTAKIRAIAILVRKDKKKQNKVKIQETLYVNNSNIFFSAS